MSAPVGPDGTTRCPWANSTPDYIAYHDEEWGRPVRDDRGMFERLTLEAFQSGLSWLTILRKRPGFRRAFADFDIATVAGYDEADEARLLADTAIVRNRAKVGAALRNARAALELPDGLAVFLWSYAPEPDGRAAPLTLADVPAKTPESTAMAKALKRNGFAFVGPTTCYAMMQATGMVNDHLADCVVRATVVNASRTTSVRRVAAATTPQAGSQVTRGRRQHVPMRSSTPRPRE
ncbi:DNA-3-methyladenine glycosylase I [Actinopolymorpha sp. B11F2]|uniref:DNA-3-methyladenine glycosylase I n=1 Tax=Actinopolymorpha sp. B11F2 TaxID=3160862 RepID=UPI0032E42D4F